MASKVTILAMVFNCSLLISFYMVNITHMGAHRGSKGEPSLPPGKKKKKKKKSLKKICTNKILTCNRTPSYVMRENFSQKAPMLCVQYSKRPPCYALNWLFLSKKAPMTCAKFLSKKAPML